VPLLLSSRLTWFAVILILAAPLDTAASAAADASFTEANRLYEQERYTEAIESYQALLQQGIHSPALYFNLGNAFFQANHPGQAILNYRLAQQLAPRDPAIRANLLFARQSIAPNLLQTEPLWKTAVLRLTLDEWTLLTLVALWSFLALLVIAQLQPRTRAALRPMRLVLAIVTLLSIPPLITAWREHHRPMAIVIVPDAAVRFGPFQESQEHYVVPDGAELHVLDQFNEWLQVRDPQERLGWLSSNQVARLP
jgi:tetratricopeptide (TPR) repeat protein